MPNAVLTKGSGSVAAYLSYSTGRYAPTSVAGDHVNDGVGMDPVI